MGGKRPFLRPSAPEPDLISARSDVVGSLLRPPELLEAQQLAAAGELAPGDLKLIEDRSVDRALELQTEAGLDVVTDGEMRRLSFQSQLVAAVDGFSEWDIDAFLWGNWRSNDLGGVDIERPPLSVRDKLKRRRWLSADEFSYAHDRTEAILKVTLPSPSLFANFWNPQTSTGAYGRLQDFLADVAEILRKEVTELARLGCTYIQLDAPHYPLLIDPGYRDFYEGRGWPAERWLELGLELDNAVIAGHESVTFGFHL